MRLGSDLANGGKGPFMSIDTRAGSMRNWAAFRFWAELLLRSQHSCEQGR